MQGSVLPMPCLYLGSGFGNWAGQRVLASTMKRSGPKHSLYCWPTFLSHFSWVRFFFSWPLSMALLLVVGFLLFQLLNFRIALLLTDNWKLVSGISEINKQIWSFSGLVYLTLSFLWLVYGQSNNLLSYSFVGLFFGAYVWRLVKAWRACVQANLEWYYLILYLCALEILPILFVWRWFSGLYN